MKQKATRAVSAFTLIEALVLIVAIAIVGVLVAMLLPALRPARSGNGYPSCFSNLKDIGTAYRLWADDNGNRNPAEQTVANGGWKDLLANADQGAICWTNYALMGNELSQRPKLLLCPKDERKPAATFTNNFDNTHLSYFVGVSANEAHPQSLMGGDRNLGPGTKPGPDYGFSTKSGKGNDVAIPISGPVSWSLKMHTAGKTFGAGNILLGDGSVQQVSTASFNVDWLRHADPTTNWPAGHVPSSPSIRLVFP